MTTIRSTAYVVAVWLFVCLGNTVAISRCRGDEDTVRFELLESFDNPLPVYQVGFSKNGQLLACYCNVGGFPEFGKVHLWNVNTGKAVRRIRPNPRVSYYFASAPYARLCFWTALGLEVQDDLTNSTKTLIRLNQLEASAEMGKVFFSADGEYLAAIRKDDKTVNVWDMRSGKQVVRLALPDVNIQTVRSVAFDATSRFIAAGFDTTRIDVPGAVIVWELKTGHEELHSQEAFRVFQVGFCAHGDLIYAGGRGGPDGLDESGTVKIRKAGKFGEARTIPAACAVMSFVMVPHVGLVTGDWHGQVALWDIATGRQLASAKEVGGPTVSLAVGQNGRLVASGDWDSIVRLWKIGAVQAREK